ncbi:MAG: YfhO family protein [Anaerolineae bacterium]
MKRWLPEIIMIGATVVLFHRLLIGEVLYWGTPSIQFYPWRETAFSMLRSGTLPLWNPMLGSGAPLLANYQTAVFYPPNWLYLILPTSHAMGLVALVHIPLAGLGMVAYLRRLSVGRLGQGVGGLAYALSGYMVGRFGFLSVTSTIAWLPWLMWAVDGLMTSGSERLRWSIRLAVVTGLMLLAGHAQTAFYSLLLAGMYALWRVLSSDRKAWIGRLGAALGGVLLGVGIAAVQLAPTLELMLSSQRSTGVAVDEALSFSYWPWRFLTIVAPNLFGTPARGTYWGFGWHWEDATFVGVLTVAMAVTAFVAWLRARRTAETGSALHVVPFYAVLLPVVFLLALGNNTPVYIWLYNNVPTFDLFRAPARWILLAVFALSVLGAIGVEHWRVTRRSVRWVRLSVVGGLAAALAAGAAAGFLAGTREATFIWAGVRFGLTVAVTGGLGLLLWQAQRKPEQRPRWELAVLLVLALDLISAGWGLNPTIAGTYYRRPAASTEPVSQALNDGRVFMLPSADDNLRFDVYFRSDDFQAEDTDLWLSLRDSMLPNVTVMQGLRAAHNDDPLLVGVYADRFEQIAERLGTRQLDLIESMGVTVLVTDFPRADLPEVYRDEHVIAYAVPAPWPRASLANCDEAWACVPEQPLSVEDAGPHEVRIRVDATQEAAVLLLDTHYPGWQAALDGQPVPVERANGAFRAVVIPPGEHELVFRYRPQSIMIGGAVTLAACLAAAVGYSLATEIDE